jgi:sulfite reductase (ferredoxin)
MKRDDRIPQKAERPHVIAGGPAARGEAIAPAPVAPVAPPERPDLAEPLVEEIATIRSQIERFRAGALAPEKFRALRLVNGIYGQKQSDVHMIRVKIPNGVMTARQLEALAEVAENHGHGIAHVTTRQDVQFHFIPLEEIPTVLERLARAGMMSREACGNSVRNVTSCPYSGVCRDEPFAVLPYAQAVARYLLRHPAAQLLGRKFKIAFSGCAIDCALGAIHDIGAIATTRGGERGFRLLAGGGLGPTPYVAQAVDEFVPAADILRACEALVRLFALHGNRRNRNAARSKFILAKWGIEKFGETYREILATVASEQRADLLVETYLTADEVAMLRAAGSPPRPTADAPLAYDDADATVAADPAFREWVRRNVVSQRQPGRAAVTVSLPLGDLRASQLREVARIAVDHGDDDVRATVQQNILLRGVHFAHLPTVFTRLRAIGLARATAHTSLDVTSCPGADTCNLGITSSRGLARALTAELEAAGVDRDLLRDEPIKISGCPNGCGQHHTASIGFHGVSRKVDQHQAPFYQMHLGGLIDGRASRVAKGSLFVPAKKAPEAARRLIELYQERREPGERLADFLHRAAIDDVREWLGPLLVAAPPELPSGHFADWGRDEAFTTATIGTGECAGAGMDAATDPFEEVAVGLREGRLFLAAGQHADALAEIHRAVLFAARVVLASGIGKETITDWETLCEFRSRLVDRGHASPAWNEIREEIDALLGSTRVAPARVEALIVRADAFLRECRGLLTAIRSWRADPSAPPLPGLSAHGGGDAIG